MKLLMRKIVRCKYNLRRYLAKQQYQLPRTHRDVTLTEAWIRLNITEVTGKSPEVRLLRFGSFKFSVPITTTRMIAIGLPKAQSLVENASAPGRKLVNLT